MAYDERLWGANKKLFLLFFLVWGAACTGLQKESTRVAWQAPVQRGGRLVAALDISGNLQIDAADWVLFDAIAAQVATRLQGDLPNIVSPDPSLQPAFYEGIPNDGDPVLALVTTDGESVDAAAVPSDRLIEAYIESKWLSSQARLFAGAKLLSRPVLAAFSDLVPGFSSETMSPQAVCTAVTQIDTRVYERASLVPTAVLDLDSTVWFGNVMDVFLAALIELELPKAQANAPLQKFLKSVEGLNDAIIDRNDVLANATLLFQRSRQTGLSKAESISAKDAFYQIVGLLAGLTVEAVERAATVAFQEGALGLGPWREQVFMGRGGCTMVEVVSGLKRSGIDVYLLSATLDVLALQGAAMLGVPRDRVLGSLLEINNGKYTGQVRLSTYYTKASITRQWLQSPPIVAFGDSPSSDFFMLREATGAAFMVNPRDELLARDANEAAGLMTELRFDGIVAGAFVEELP